MEPRAVFALAAAGAVAATSFLLTPPPVAWLTAGLGWALLALALSDLRTMRLPDRLTLPLVVAGLAAAALLPGAAWRDHLAGAAAGFGFAAAVAWGYRRLRGRDGLGMGDAKLLAAAGAWVSWVGLPTVLVWACLSALALVAGLRLAGRPVDGATAIPFGPHLALGIWLTWVLGPLESA